MKLKTVSQPTTKVFTIWLEKVEKLTNKLSIENPILMNFVNKSQIFC